MIFEGCYKYQVIFLLCVVWMTKGFLLLTPSSWRTRTKCRLNPNPHRPLLSNTSPTATTVGRQYIDLWTLFDRSDDIADDYYDDESDEDLFVALFNEKIIQDKGAGTPRPTLHPEEIMPLLMVALKNNDKPGINSGLISMWEFSSDTTKFIFQNNMTEYIESCHETAAEFPTSFYGVAMNGQSWDIETELNRVGGDDGWIATQVMKTISSDGRLRRWQWEFRKNKRPPCLGCWKVETIASSDRNGDFEATDRGTGWSD